MENLKDYPTDKYDTGLIADYERLFLDLKKRPVKYLEIGILKGGSLLWAKNYFAKGSEIYGLDIEIKSKSINGVVMSEIDQADSAKLSSFGKEMGPFDIIVDDGCHFKTLTENTFNCLYPYLKKGGKYIIEDWGAGYLPNLECCKGMEALVTDLVWYCGGAIYKLAGGGSYAVINK